MSAKSTWLLFLLPILLLLCDACHSQKGCKGVRYYTTQHSGNSGSVAKPHSMAVSRSSGVRKKGSGTLSFSSRSSSHKSGSGILTLTSPSAKKKKPGNMGFYKPKPQKNGSVSMTFSKKKVKAKPLPPWTKKAQRMDKRKAKSGVTKGGKKPSKHSMEH